MDLGHQNEPMSSRKTQLTWIFVALVSVLVIDQATKALVIHYIPEMTVISDGSTGPKFFQLTHQRNFGIVNGIFSSNRFLAFAAPLFATGVLLFLYRYLARDSKLQALAYGMIGGGALGNLVDRVRLGSVTDFLQFYFYFIPFDFPWKYYPAFNVADSAICVGVFLLMVCWYVMGADKDAVNAL